MRKYVVISVSLLTRDLVEQCLETAVETCRRSLDGTLAVVSFYEAPAALAELLQYDAEQLLAYLDHDDWRDLDAINASCGR